MSQPNMGKWLEVAMNKPTSTESGLSPVASLRTSGFSSHLLGPTEKLQPRLLFTFQVLIGCTVQVKVKDGKIYRGIFSTVEIESPGTLSIVLKMATSLQNSQGQSNDWKQIAETPVASMIIAGGDLVSLAANAVHMDSSSVGPAPEDMGFGTDSAISKDKGGAGLIGRRLEKWVPETDEPLAMLEDTSFGTCNARGWDQFAANSAMYGVQTTFDEGFYTTQLDKTNAGITEQDAERIAREIEKGSKGVNNRHVLEERGIVVDDSGELDEEDRYSSVIRTENLQPCGVRTSEGKTNPKSFDRHGEIITGTGAHMSSLQSKQESRDVGIVQEAESSCMKPGSGEMVSPDNEVFSKQAASVPVTPSNLNANAKPFVLNPKAKEFVPSLPTSKPAVSSSQGPSSKNARSPNFNWNSGPGYQHMMAPSAWASSGHAPPIHGGSWVPPSYQHPGMISGSLPQGGRVNCGGLLVSGGAMGRSSGYSGSQAMSNGSYGHPQSVHFVSHGQFMILPTTAPGTRSENVPPRDLQVKGFNPTQHNSMQDN